ncbi:MULTISPECIES: hypothetical protein [unclassified Mesorhizobium]|uniref:hypothetical protein n=1 Tax=unclassified Mesorhizobium TaxID=325217 RepID=UPI001FE0C8BC|nr:MULTISPECIES: hypothetical protein [unclassified Mesorhizobium]
MQGRVRDADRSRPLRGKGAMGRRVPEQEGALITIDFEVSYLLERRDGKLKVFGWISGDEQAEFRKHGLL